MFEQDESMLRFGVTPVENLFIQEYLPAARGDYVKVYLYALYTSAHPKKELSAAEIAQELGMPQSDVEGALRYWERRHLLVRLTDNPPAYQMKSPAQLLLSGEAGMEADSAFVAFSEDIYALFWRPPQGAPQRDCPGLRVGAGSGAAAGNGIDASVPLSQHPRRAVFL